MNERADGNTLAPWPLSDLAAAWRHAARCWPPQYVNRVQLRPTYTSLEEASEDIVHQLVTLADVDEPEEWRLGAQALHETAAPEIAQALLHKGYFMVAASPRMRNLNVPRHSLETQRNRIYPFPPHGTVSNQRSDTPLRSPIPESRIWEPLNTRVQSLTLERNLAALSPPSYSDAIAQRPNTYTTQQALRMIDADRSAQLHRPAASSTPGRPNTTVRDGQSDPPVKIQSNTMRMWTKPERGRHEKVKINIVATMMSSGEHSISIECNGRSIDGGLVGKNVSIVTNLFSDATDLARWNQRRVRESTCAACSGDFRLVDED